MKRWMSIALVGLSLAATPAWAADNTFDGSTNNNWEEAANWSLSHVPTASETAIIPSPFNVIVTSTSAIAFSIEVEAGATLLIDDDQRLTLDATSALPVLVSSIIEGEVTIDIGGALRIDNASHSFYGDGAVIGMTTDSLVEIEYGRTLYNELPHPDGGIRGSLTVTAVGTPSPAYANFVNMGQVEAWDSGLVIMSGSVELSDVEGALWIADSDPMGEPLLCQSTIEFNRTSESLAGDFETALSGIFKINQNVKTCGSLTYNTGMIDVATSKTFKFATFATSSCSNPKDTGTGGCSTGIFTVSTDDTCGACD